MIWLLGLLAGCGEGPIDLVVVTFNTGTTTALPHDDPPDDGYGSTQADLSDTWYGDGLAWTPVIEDAGTFFADLGAGVVAFQEMFSTTDCATVPEQALHGFVCEDWSDGDPTVAERVLGDGYQVACHPGKPDKCVAVHASVGGFDGCDTATCPEALDGMAVEGCGSGARVAAGTVRLARGDTLRVVSIHGTSGFLGTDQQCRLGQFDQAFDRVEGDLNLVLGDLNTDPGRLVDADDSAAFFAEQAAVSGLAFLSEIGADATPTYAGLYNIDHVLSDTLTGDCWTAGVTEGQPPVSDVVYFDHHPVVCRAIEPGR